MLGIINLKAFEGIYKATYQAQYSTNFLNENQLVYQFENELTESEKKFLKAFCKYIDDCLISDREISAFIATLKMFENLYI